MPRNQLEPFLLTIVMGEREREFIKSDKYKNRITGRHPKLRLHKNSPFVQSNFSKEHINSGGHSTGFACKLLKISGVSQYLHVGLYKPLISLYPCCVFSCFLETYLMFLGFGSTLEQKSCTRKFISHLNFLTQALKEPAHSFLYLSPRMSLTAVFCILSRSFLFSSVSELCQTVADCPR